MDILIKGMEMPKDCYNCKFLLANYDESEYQITCYFCFLEKETICEGDDRELAKGIKPSTCPLVALPEHHGRLGDLDALKNSVADMRMEKPLRNGAKQVIEIGELFGRIIEDAPTIVEANNE